MNTIESQIEALTQELRPYPDSKVFYWFDGIVVKSIHFTGTNYDRKLMVHALYWSGEEKEVEEYADCYKRLKLYQLIGEKREKEFPLDWNNLDVYKYGTDFGYGISTGSVPQKQLRRCVLGGVWFSREEDRLEALKICGIDAEFQKRCAKYQLGGA